MPTDQLSDAVRDDAKTPATAAPLRLDSASLFGASRELIIVHNGREYRLRMTQNEKLILTA